MIKDLLLGQNGVAPIVVNIARGALEVGILAALAYVTTQLEVVEWGDKAFLGAGSLWGISRLAGLVDQFVDPSQNRKAG